MIDRLYGWLVKKWLYHRGIRFYESKTLPSHSESIRTQFSGKRKPEGTDIRVTFEFFREVFKDKVYRQGVFTTEEYEVFFIRATVEGQLDPKLLKFNDTRLLCKHGFFPRLADEAIADILQGLYIAYMKEQLQHPET